MADEIASLFATVGAKVDASSWAKADAQLRRSQKAAQQFADLATKDPGRAAAALAVAQSRMAAAQAATQGKIAAAAKRESDKIAAAHEKAAERSRAAYVNAARATALAGVALAGVGAYLGGRLVKSGIEFNSTMEDSRLKIASMLALARHSSLSTELGTADGLVANLQRRAATLPGTTSEYIAMLGMIAQPLTDAKLGLGDLEDLTVQSVVAAKALGIQWEVAARDVDQAVRGQFHSVDPFSGKVLGSIGYKGEEGRSRFNQLSQQKRALEIKRALMQPQFTELGAEQGKSFSGRLSTLQDTWEQFKGAMTKPLFRVLGEQIVQANAWLAENKAKVDAAAEAIGGALVSAFGALKTGVLFAVDAYHVLHDAFDAVSSKLQWFTEHAQFTKSLLISMGIIVALFGVRAMWAGRQAALAFAAAGARAALAWIQIAGPIGVALALLTAAVYEVIDHWDWIRDKALTVGRELSDFFTETLPRALETAFDAIADLPVLKQIIWALKEAASFIEDDGVPGIAGQLAAGLATNTAAAGTGSAGGIGFAAGGLQPSLPRSAFTGAPTSTVNVGGMTLNVSSTSADPKAVALEASKAVRAEMGAMLRQTMDEQA